MQAGDPAKLGATPMDGGVNFALYSSVAERIELCLFDAAGRLLRQVDLPECQNDVWHGFLPGTEEGQCYGYRVHGPFQPDRGLYCNPAKLLTDPYARQLDGELTWHSSIVKDSDDSAAYVPKSVVRGSPASLAKTATVPWSETTFYELNVRGYTMRHPAVDKAKRGTFVGMCNKDVIAYIKSLGITSIELMPVHEFIDEHHLVEKGLRNFWGYNSINFFAPAQRYSIDDPIAEFRDMTNTLHDAGLEVILDVVYNHTAEGGRDGPTLSFRGIDNLAYYRVDADHRGQYINDTGCGNTINANSDVVQQLVIDSLRYWAVEMGVDGFRFDLATVLGRHPSGFSGDHPLLTEIAEDPVLRNVKLVAEPWDPGPGGYQLGNFRSPWAELNDKFRDTSRRFWRGDTDVCGEFAARLRASADIFEAEQRRPHSSVNKITSHDGFTLADLVSYEHRHNKANGEDNRDGHSNNYSCNYGVEGPSNDGAIVDARRRHRLNLLATLFLSQGTPMLLAGDEFGNSQDGNNNAYAQDNDIGWLDWNGVDADPAFLATVCEIIRLRKEIPVLQLDEYVHGKATVDGESISIRWINPDGGERSNEDWGFGHAFGVVLESRSSDTGDTLLAVLMNAWEGDLQFALPGAAENRWRCLFSSAGVDDDVCVLRGRSVSVFKSTTT